MSWMELWEFVFALPLNSMTKCALRGDNAYRRWTETEYLLNRNLDMLTMIMQILWAGYEVSGKPPRGPIVTDPDLRTPEDIELEERRSERLRRFVEATRPGSGDSEYLSRLQEITASVEASPAPVRGFGNGPVKVDPKQLSQAEMDQLLAFRAIREQATRVAQQDKAAEEPREQRRGRWPPSSDLSSHGSSRTPPGSPPG